MVFTNKQAIQNLVADKQSNKRWVTATDQKMGMTTMTDAAAVNDNAADLVTLMPGEIFATSSVEQLPLVSDQINITDNMDVQKEI